MPANAIDPAPTLPTPPSPGSVSQSVRRIEKATTPPAEVLFRRDDGQSDHDPNAKRFRVNAFDFYGNTAFDSYRLKRVMDRFVDRELNLYDLSRAADAVNEFYQRMGYPLARALVPAQKVVDGRVRIDVVEGVLGKVKVSGNRSYSEARLRQMGGTLDEGAPIRQAPLEQKLLILNDQPGLKVRATLVPGAQYGSTDLLIQAEESRLALDAAITNAAREDIGQNRLDVTATWNNPLGLGDALSLRGMVSEHQLLKYGKLAYGLPLTNSGGRLNLSYANVAYNVAGQFALLDLAGKVRTSEIGYTQPLIRTRQHDRNVGLTVNYRELRQTGFGITPSLTHLAIATANWNERWIDEEGTAWNARAAVSSNGRSNADSNRTDAERLKLDLSTDASVAITDQWNGFAKVQWIYSRQTLPDSDKFDIGGPDSVRAYRPSELRGDSGVALTIEARRPLLLLGRAAQATVFADYGRVAYKQKNFRNGDDEIGGVGLGLTVYPSAKSTIKVEYARALTTLHSDDGKRGRVWFNLGTSF